MTPRGGRGVGQDGPIVAAHHEQLVCSAVLYDGLVAVALNDDPRTALRYDDFGDGTRQRYWQVVLDLLATEVRPDVTVVADRAYRLGFHDVTLEWLEATRAYLRVHGVDSVANAPYWAKAVRESSDWRGVRQAAEDIYGLTVDRTRLSLPEARARALQLVTRIRTAEQEETGYAPLGAETDDLLTDVDDWFEGRPVRSLTTGFPSLDEYLGGGMRPARLVLLGGRPGMMKAQPLDAKVLTPEGFRRMGDLGAGDRVMAADGEIARVVGVYPQGVKPVFRLTFADGGQTEACDDHLWWTSSRTERKADRDGSVKTTAQLRATLTCGDGRPNHHVPFVRPVHFPMKILSLDPYVLGVILGDGSCPVKGNVRVYNRDRDVRARLLESLPRQDTATEESDGLTLRIKRRQYNRTRRSETHEALRELGLLGLHSYEKFVPRWYLHGDVAQRTALLQGLVDTDGFVYGTGVRYTTTSPRLRDDVVFLVRSLGGYAKVVTKAGTLYPHRGERRQGRTSYDVIVTFPPNGVRPYWSERRRERSQEPIRRRTERVLIGIEPAGEKACQCIKLDREDGLYVTDDFVVTHNTAFGLHLVHNVAAGLALTGEKGCVAVQSLEMERGDLNLQMACRYAGVDMRLLTAGRLARAPERQAMRAAVAEELERIRALPIMVDHTDSVSSDQIYFRVSLLHAANPIKLLVIDYAELVGDEAEAGEEIRVSGIFRRAKALAKGLKIPVILLCQLNRQVEGRMNKMPASSDIRYSGSAEAVADYVWLCFDPWKYKEMGQEVEPGSDFRGWEDGKRWYLVIAKARYGRVGFIELRRDAPLTLLKDPLADEVRFGSDPLLRGGNGVWLPGLEVGGGDRRGRDTVQAQNVDRGQPAETSWRLTGDGRALPGA